jgi:DNA-binding CsgD family transcriptional regulator
MENRLPGSGRRTSLLGRERECALLGGLIADVRGGKSRSLVLRGDAGIGKTALLQHLAESASDLSVTQAAGVELEMEMAYAALHQLCPPLLGRLPRLAAPQRQALEIVFGLSSGAPPDQFLVALAALSLFSEAADERPLLCIVDDAQWLDDASALTLAFVSRRLLAEPVGIVFAARDPVEALERLPTLDLHGLDDADARALLRSAVGFALDERTSERVIAETRGNPLALLELPRGLTATELASGFGVLGGQPLSGRIQETFVRRLEALSHDARRLLLVAAADAAGDPLLLWRAAKRLGIGVGAADEVEAQGLLVIAERVTFRHPLVRSAVTGSATAEERRAVHLALAEATDAAADPDRRAWHLAAAAAGPDEDIAHELELAAVRARARGGFAAAAAILQRAVALTGDPTRRPDRALAAADVSLQAGAFDVARRLLNAAEAGQLDAFQRARAERLRAQVAFAVSRGRDAPRLLLAAAKRLERLDVRLARETYLEAISAAQFAGRLAGSEGDVLAVAQTARSAPPPPHPPLASDLLLDGLATLITEGYESGAPAVQLALSAFCRGDLPSDEAARWLYLACRAAGDVWDFDRTEELSERMVSVARDLGALTALPIGLVLRASAHVQAGRLDTGSALFDEAEAINQATGSRSDPYGQVLLAAWRGREHEATALIDATLREVSTRGEGRGVTVAYFARAALFNGLGRYEEALDAASLAVAYPGDLLFRNRSLVELVEAGARTGNTQVAAEALASLAQTTAPSATDWALGIEACCRAQLSEGNDADALYLEAITKLGRTRVRVALARAHLLYGEWLRREHRRVDARRQLRAAHDHFTSIGAEAFAERARHELLATGEKVRRRTVETRDELTPQERQIALLARDRLTNPEIAARLFLSHHTVEYHLHKVFTKLGVSSRRELANALSASDSELVPAY